MKTATRKIIRQLLCAGVLSLAASTAMAAAQSKSAVPNSVAKVEEPKIEHPGEIALMKGDTGWSYRHAETGYPLYVSDRDVGGKSACNGGCARAWVPLEVNVLDNKPVGDWKIIVREDGSRQWAYKGRPAYTLFHDSPDNPVGDGVEGVWHILEP